MGYSDCRFCGCNNGDSDLSDGDYLWPSGFAHYLEAHDVKPPKVFLEHIRANNYQVPPKTRTQEEVIAAFKASVKEKT
jgi:hypothetical protein